jgi:hypothetical protein
MAMCAVSPHRDVPHNFTRNAPCRAQAYPARRCPVQQQLSVHLLALPVVAFIVDSRLAAVLGQGLQIEVAAGRQCGHAVTGVAHLCSLQGHVAIGGDQQPAVGIAAGDIQPGHALHHGVVEPRALLRPHGGGHGDVAAGHRAQRIAGADLAADEF